MANYGEATLDELISVRDELNDESFDVLATPIEIISEAESATTRGRLGGIVKIAKPAVSRFIKASVEYNPSNERRQMLGIRDDAECIISVKKKEFLILNFNPERDKFKVNGMIFRVSNHKPVSWNTKDPEFMTITLTSK